MAANSPNIYCPLALYRAGAQDGRPYGKALRLYEFAGKNTFLKACTARASVASPTVSWAIICPPNTNLLVCLRMSIYIYVHYTRLMEPASSWAMSRAEMMSLETR